jgi:hypothetical protein
LSAAEQQALQSTRLHREGNDLLALDFPLRSGIDQQATVGVARERHAALRLLDESIAMPGRDIDPTFRIQRQRTTSLKHPSYPT